MLISWPAAQITYNMLQFTTATINTITNRILKCTNVIRQFRASCFVFGVQWSVQLQGATISLSVHPTDTFLLLLRSKFRSCSVIGFYN